MTNPLAGSVVWIVHLFLVGGRERDPRRGIKPVNITACVQCLHPSEVWLGEYQGMKVAMKSMKECLTDEKAKTQFLAEASTMT